MICVSLLLFLLLSLQSASAVFIELLTYSGGANCTGPTLVGWPTSVTGKCHNYDYETSSSKLTCGLSEYWEESPTCEGTPSRSQDYTAHCFSGDVYSYRYSCIEMVDPVMISVSHEASCDVPIEDALTFIVDNGVCSPMGGNLTTGMTMSYRAVKNNISGGWTVSYWMTSATCEGTAYSFPETDYSTTCRQETSLPLYTLLKLYEVEHGAAPPGTTATPTISTSTRKPTASGSITAAGAPALQPLLLLAAMMLLLV